MNKGSNANFHTGGIRNCGVSGFLTLGPNSRKRLDPSRPIPDVLNILANLCQGGKAGSKVARETAKESVTLSTTQNSSASEAMPWLGPHGPCKCMALAGGHLHGHETWVPGEQLQVTVTNVCTRPPPGRIPEVWLCTSHPCPEPLFSDLQNRGKAPPPRVAWVGFAKPSGQCLDTSSRHLLGMG